jgi:hemoglobin-like flavoprotein
MTPDQIRLVQDSWTRAAASPERTAGLFYGRLLGTDPTVAHLFRNTAMDEQGLKFMQMMDTAVRHLERLQPGASAPQDLFASLGQRHAGIGVRAEHYQALGDALVWALKRILSRDFTPAHEEAWWAMYTLVASVMQSGPAQSATGHGAQAKR